MNKLTQALAAASIALAAPFAAHAATNLVTNGSFEVRPYDGGFDGWTVSLADPFTYVDQGNASDGLWSVWFGSATDAGGSTISQTLATTAGQQYTLTFDLADDNGGGDASNAFMASVGGVAVYSASALGDQGYAQQSFTFTATGASTVLSFTGANDVGYVLLDDVSVTAVPVPEPAQAALLLGGLTLLARRRRA